MSAQLQSAPNNLLTDDQAAALLGIKPQTLAAWRMTGRYALPYLRVGRCVRYRPADIEAWLTSRRVGVNQSEMQLV